MAAQKPARPPAPAAKSKKPRDPIVDLRKGGTPPAAAGGGMTVRVKEGQKGYYARRRLREGTVFFLHDKNLFSSVWMEPASNSAELTPNEEDTAQAALDRETNALNGVDGEPTI